MGTGTIRGALGALIMAAGAVAPAFAEDPAPAGDRWWQPAPSGQAQTAQASGADTKSGDTQSAGTQPGEAQSTDTPPAAAPSDAPAPAPAVEPPVETVPVQAAAPPVPSATRLDDVMVTSQKRVQSIQDVPISMTALTGQMLYEQGVTDVREALQLTPNARVDSAGFFAAPRMRGFTLNNNNKSFEPPVGMVFDGIPHTRVEYFMAALMDVERIEVMRGPQGTTFGKNTTAGLVSLISARPSDSPQGFLTLEGGELNRRRIEAAYGGALTDGLNVRVAGLLDQRDGFIDNTTHAVLDSAPDKLKGRKRNGLRMTLEAPDLWGADLLLTHERYQLYDGGAALENVLSGPQFQQAVRGYDPNADFTRGNWITSQDYPDYRDVAIQSTHFELDRDLGAWQLVVLGAYSVLDQKLSLDTDFTPAPAILGSGGDHSPESYGEIRFTAPTADGLLGLSFLPGNSDLLVGFTGGRRQMLNSHFAFGINNKPFWDLVTAAAADAGDTGSSAGAVGGIVGGAPSNTDKFDAMDQAFNQTSDDLSAFAHLKWQFLTKLALELGGRYTQEKKNGAWNLVFTTPEPNDTLRAIGTEPFTATRDMNLRNFQPKIALDWSVLRDVSVFAHWEKGFKAGGFNAFAFREGTCSRLPDGSPDPSDPDCQGFAADDLTFRDEVADNYGLDIKTWLFDHSANLNVSFFRETVHDFQVLIRENPPGTIGSGTSRVINAPKARAQGIETDLRWLPTTWLSVMGGAGVLDTKFLDFKQGECPVGSSHANSDGDSDPHCDQTGKAFPFAPRLSAALSLRLTLPMDGLPWVGSSLGGLSFVGGTMAEYESSQLLDIDADERKRQPSYTRYKADLGVSSLPRRWTVRLVGENLTNTVTWVRWGDVFEDVITGSQNQPRLFYLQFRQDF